MRSGEAIEHAVEDLRSHLSRCEQVATVPGCFPLRYAGEFLPTKVPKGIGNLQLSAREGHRRSPLENGDVP